MEVSVVVCQPLRPLRPCHPRNLPKLRLDRVAEGFTSLIPMGKGGHEALAIDSRGLNLWNLDNRTLEDAMCWWEGWVHGEADAIRLGQGSPDAATMLPLPVELAQALKRPLVVASIEHMKYIDMMLPWRWPRSRD